MQLIVTAEALAAKAEFQAAIRFYNDALQTQPEPAYIDENARVQELHEMLMAQREPVEVSVKSDGKTTVSIMNMSGSSQNKTTTFKLFPGDYVIVGTRDGFRDVNLLGQVRDGTPPPVFTVICEEHSAKKSAQE